MNILKDRFKGRTILITGSTSGIGEATALRAAAEGANIVVNGRNAERGNAVVDRIKADGGEAIFVQADLTIEAEVDKLFDTAFEKYGEIQLFVNNAGMICPPDRLIEFRNEDWFETMDTNVTSMFYCCRREVQHLMQTGKPGSIVNLGSIAGMRGFPSSCAYVTSKHAVNGLTKAIAMEYAHKNIRCNSVNPCGCGSPLNHRTDIAYKEKMGKVAMEGGDPMAYLSEWLGGKRLSPLGRLGTVDEEAAAILFFLSDDASFITGAIVAVEGGWGVY
ncbi:MAG: SDR family oxidoreductase [Clostridia bacterium]|nr:SDR family oxidoreductase [Clostridia bacterium]